jgi:cytochrome c553
MRYIPLVVVAVVFGSATIVANADTRSPKSEEAAVDKAVNLCSTCHGPRGVSTSPEFPTLAGQREAYLIAQMKAFRDRSRADKEAHQYMWGIAAQLDDVAIEGIARYYSSQPPPPARPVNEALAVQGSELFRQGVPHRGIPACATCHGQNAEGGGEKPRLAGQHAKYVDKQLRYIQMQQRDPLAMRGTLKDLSPLEREAVAAYVQSLGPQGSLGSAALNERRR